MELGQNGLLMQLQNRLLKKVTEAAGFSAGGAGFSADAAGFGVEVLRGFCKVL
jgi:hypothetical protein